MSRSFSEESATFSPTQRKACLVLALCLLAVVLSIVVAGFLPPKIAELIGVGDSYDPSLYPVDTTLESILGENSAGEDYIADTVFIGDQYTISLQKDGSINLNRYVGTDGLKISELLSKPCVYFTEDASAYTIPQAIAKMKPRRVILTLGSNDVDGSVSVDAFIQDYKQALQQLNAAYSYCDIIANCIPPVLSGTENASQALIDQFNQAIAVACNDMGNFKFLNSAEVLKNERGYGEATYFDGTAFSGSGVNMFLNYVRNHAYVTEDRRPNVDDIPERAAEPADESSAAPSPTPKPFVAVYSVADSAQGSLTGNGQVNVSTLSIEVSDRGTASVTAVPATGYAFDRWSDGQTSETRYDVMTQDITVTAMFKDARVSVTLDRGDTSMKVGEELPITAAVKLGSTDYDSSNVQWSVNNELEMNGATFTFRPTAAGTYVIKAGLEVNGGFQTAQLTVTVTADAAPTAIRIVSDGGVLTVGATTVLSVVVTDPVGEVIWGCDQTSWTAVGTQVNFTAYAAGTYTIRAKNNGVEDVITLTVQDGAAPTMVPTLPTAEPLPQPTEVPTVPVNPQPTDNSGILIT